MNPIKKYVWKQRWLGLCWVIWAVILWQMAGMVEGIVPNIATALDILALIVAAGGGYIFGEADTVGRIKPARKGGDK